MARSSAPHFTRGPRRHPRTVASRRCVAVLLALLATAPGHAAVNVVVDDVRHDAGVLRIEVLRADDPAAGGTTFAQFVLPPRPPQVRVTLYDLPPGRYAARVHHDLDNDGRMATNLVGMPTEPWGVSNDARGRFGPPPLADMLVEIGPDGGELRMTLVH